MNETAARGSAHSELLRAYEQGQRDERAQCVSLVRALATSYRAYGAADRARACDDVADRLETNDHDLRRHQQ